MQKFVKGFIGCQTQNGILSTKNEVTILQIRPINAPERVTKDGKAIKINPDRLRAVFLAHHAGGIEMPNDRKKAIADALIGCGNRDLSLILCKQ